MAINNVVMALRQKLNGSFTTPTYFSTQQKYVKGLLNSHNNNLEEQSILGVDCVSVFWTDPVTKIKYTTKKFYDENNFSGTGYYILFDEDYTDSTDIKGYYVTNDILHLPENENIRYIEGTDYVELVNASNIYSIEDYALLIKPNGVDVEMGKSVLCYRTNLSSDSDIYLPNDDLIVSVKLRIDSYLEDKTISKEIITNNLI